MIEHPCPFYIRDTLPIGASSKGEKKQGPGVTPGPCCVRCSFVVAKYFCRLCLTYMLVIIVSFGIAPAVVLAAGNVILDVSMAVLGELTV